MSFLVLEGTVGRTSPQAEHGKPAWSFDNLHCQSLPQATVPTMLPGPQGLCTITADLCVTVHPLLTELVSLPPISIALFYGYKKIQEHE